MAQPYTPHDDGDHRHVPHEIERRGREGSAWDRLWQAAMQMHVPATFAVYFAAPFMFGVSTLALAVVRDLQRSDSRLVNVGYGAGFILFAASVALAAIGLWQMNWVGRIATAYVGLQLLRTQIGHAELSVDEVVLPLMISLGSEIVMKIWRGFRSSRRRDEEFD